VVFPGTSHNLLRAHTAIDDIDTDLFNSTLLVYYTQVQKDVLESSLLEKLTQLHNELSAFGVEDLYTKEYFRGPSSAEEKRDSGCCGQGNCSDSKPGDEGSGEVSGDPSGGASGGCCKNQVSKTCRSSEPSKPVNPASVVASYQKRVDDLVSQLPLPQGAFN
jgi:hypothetical protein